MTASHRELPLDALEHLSVGANTIGVTAVTTCEPIVGAVVLATCNRFELYLDVDAPLSGSDVAHAVGHVAGLVAAASGVDAEVAARSFCIRTGDEVAEHLFAVASGLESMVVGEQEVGGQVKRAFADAHEAQTCSPALELLFQRASRTSKQVATQTSLKDAGRSIVALAFTIAAEELPPWPQTRALIVGTGAYAGATLAALRVRGCTDACVYSPSGRAEAFADRHGIRAVRDLAGALADVDLVVSCSGARGRRTALGFGSFPGGVQPVGSGAALARLADEKARVGKNAGFVVTPDIMTAARSRQMGGVRRQVVLDLALHRDIDPGVAAIDGVRLYDLAMLADRAPVTGAASIAEAWTLVKAAASEFEEALLGRRADQAVVALMAQAEKDIAAEVTRRVAVAERNGDTALDVDALTRSVRRQVRAQLHPRILRVRAEAIATARAAQDAA